MLDIFKELQYKCAGQINNKWQGKLADCMDLATDYWANVLDPSYDLGNIMQGLADKYMITTDANLLDCGNAMDSMMSGKRTRDKSNLSDSEEPVSAMTQSKSRLAVPLPKLPKMPKTPKRGSKREGRKGSKA